MIREYKHAHFYCGLGGFAKGFNQAVSRLGSLQARWRCLGGIDNDPGSCADFQTLTGVTATCLDLFSREQYEAFHGHEPPEDWREVTVDDVRRAFANERPNVVCISAPCKGFSGLLSQERSTERRYQALNELALRGLWLALEAWKDDPPEFFLFENVPRIAVRGRPLLDQIMGLLEAYGYAARETSHDCGEIAEGGMSQSRKRFLLVARHTQKIPPHLYEPQKHPLKAVGRVLERMRLPGDKRAGPMHRVASLAWRTWVRLAFVKAGRDWRSLNELKVEDGYLKDFALMPYARVPDFRFNESEKWNTGHAFGVKRWNQHAATVTTQCDPGQGYFAVADPRPTREQPFRNVFRVVRWEEVGRSVTGGGHPTSGGVSVADPRTGLTRGTGDAYHTCGHYGVVRWERPCGAVTARLNHDNGPGNVADPRCAHESFEPERSRDRRLVRSDAQEHAAYNAGADELGRGGGLPLPDERLACVIQSIDNTWHRPFTTLELAGLQGLIDPEEYLELQGLSDRDWRERIGNAVPPPAARAIAGMIGQTMLMAETGETFILSATPVWVRDVGIALAI